MDNFFRLTLPKIIVAVIMLFLSFFWFAVNFGCAFGSAPFCNFARSTLLIVLPGVWIAESLSGIYPRSLFYLIASVLQILIVYLLACMITWIYLKIKKD